MSQENVEVARQVFDAMNRGDLPGAMKEATTDFIFDFSRSYTPRSKLLEREEHLALEQLRTRRVRARGVPGVLATFTGDWESMRWEPEEFIEAGGQLVTPITVYNRGRDGIEVRTRVAWVWAFRDRRVARITFFQNRSEALEAARLRE
jgi:ketosteroid isomerase-like protein